MRSSQSEAEQARSVQGEAQQTTVTHRLPRPGLVTFPAIIMLIAAALSYFRPRSFRHALLPILIAIAACSSVCSAAASATRAHSRVATPKLVSLTLKDMPRGYIQTEGKQYRSKESQISQYFVTFGKTTGHVATAVKSTVSRYRNARGSVHAYSQAIGRTHLYPGYTNLHAVNVGVKATTGSYKIKANTGSISSIAVAVLQGDWVITVTMTGPTGTFNEQQVVGYARMVSRRIKASR